MVMSNGSQESDQEPRVAVSVLKARALGLVEQVHRTGVPLLVTKRGRPIVRLVPVEPPASLRGSVRFLVSEADLLAPIDEPWEAETS